MTDSPSRGGEIAAPTPRTAWSPRTAASACPRALGQRRPRRRPCHARRPHPRVAAPARPRSRAAARRGGARVAGGAAGRRGCPLHPAQPTAPQPVTRPYRYRRLHASRHRRRRRPRGRGVGRPGRCRLADRRRAPASPLRLPPRHDQPRRRARTHDQPRRRTVPPAPPRAPVRWPAAGFPGRVRLTAVDRVLNSDVRTHLTAPGTCLPAPGIHGRTTSTTERTPAPRGTRTGAVVAPAAARPRRAALRRVRGRARWWSRGGGWRAGALANTR